GLLGRIPGFKQLGQLSRMKNMDLSSVFGKDAKMMEQALGGGAMPMQIPQVAPGYPAPMGQAAMARARLMGYSDAPMGKPVDRDALRDKRKRERQARAKNRKRPGGFARATSTQGRGRRPLRMGAGLGEAAQVEEIPVGPVRWAGEHFLELAAVRRSRVTRGGGGDGQRPESERPRGDRSPLADGPELHAVDALGWPAVLPGIDSSVDRETAQGDERQGHDRVNHRRRVGGGAALGTPGTKRLIGGSPFSGWRRTMHERVGAAGRRGSNHENDADPGLEM